MSPRKPHLFSISRLIGLLRMLPLEFFQASAILAALGAPEAVALRFGSRRLMTWHRPFLDAFLVLMFGRTIPQVHLEPCTTLVKRDCMPEVPDVAVGFREGQPARNHSD
jgi:hypothetical protein